MNGGTDAARALFQAARRAREDTRRQRERVEELSSRCRRVTPLTDGMPGHGGDGPEGLWCLLADERSRARRMEREAERLRREADAAIDSVADGAQRLVLELRYRAGLSWPGVREGLERRGLGRSLRGVYRLHDRALAAAAKGVTDRGGGQGELPRERPGDPALRDAQ